MPVGNFSDITQKDWIKACKSLGLEVDSSRGKGSHCLVKHPTTGAKYTIQRNLSNKFINIKIFKKLLEWDFNEGQIWDALK
jgi:predicted RNA binding protein YcfA (HicA-like mRNA interferase family)